MFSFHAVSKIPSGFIGQWHGAIATIPNGWALCDGNNGTPDLRDRFIVGAKQDYTGIAKSTITGVPLQILNDTVHGHAFGSDTGDADGTFYYMVTIGGTQITVSDAHVHPYMGMTSTMSHVPSFYALAYIMKL